MTYQPHPNFDTPAPDTEIWRYMDLPKFVSLLEKSALFFSRADKIGDPYEGSLTAPTLQGLRAQVDATFARIEGQGFEVDYSAAPRFTREYVESLQAARSHHLLNCWYEAEGESPAMWGSYAPGSSGVAIQSTVGELIHDLQTPRSVFIGRVHYLDYRVAQMPVGNMFWPFLHKREAFSHEHEVRAIISDQVSYPGDPPDRPLNVPEVEDGLYIEVRLVGLVHGICVAPTAPQWFVDAIQGCARRFGIALPVQQSELGQIPCWDLPEA